MLLRCLLVLALVAPLGAACSSSPRGVSFPPPTGAAGAARAVRPCELVVQGCQRGGRPCAANDQCGVTLARVAPAGEPLELVLRDATTYRWRYRADGRLLESPTHTFRYGAGDTGTMRAREGGAEQPVRVDGRGNPVALGATRLAYTPDGRVATVSTPGSGGAPRVISYRWEAHGRYRVEWTHPDAEEFCLPEQRKVELDPRGRVAKELFDSCRINYPVFSLAYQYDAEDRISAIDVECHPGTPEAESHRLTLKYACD